MIAEPAEEKKFYQNEHRINATTAVFRRPDSPMWYARVQLFQQPRVIRSLRTTDLERAKRAAETLYFELMDRSRRKLSLKTVRVADLLPRYYADLAHRLKTGKIGRTTHDNYLSNVRRDWAEYCTGWTNDKPIDEFTDDDMAAYARWRQEHVVRKRLTQGSLNIALCAVNDFFVFCVREKVIAKAPRPAYVTVEQSKVNRSEFSVAEYIRLRRVSRKRIAEATSLHARQRTILDLVIRIMAQTGLRTGEMMALRWVDCTPLRERTRRGLLISTGELHIPDNEIKPGREIVVKPYVWCWLKRLRDITGRADDESIMPYADLEGSFTRLLQDPRLRMKHDRRGNRRILYSLRHSFAQWCALYRKHWPTKLVAEMMGHELATHSKVYSRISARRASRSVMFD